MRRNSVLLVAVLTGLYIITGWVPSGSAWVRPRTIAAQNECQTFPETSKQVCGIFLSYWKANGGLAQQGYPISDVLREQSSNGQTYDTQYFERAVFERHPENAGTRFEVLLALLGYEKWKGKYGDAGPKDTGRVGERVALAETALTVVSVTRAPQVPPRFGDPCVAAPGVTYVTIELIEENIGATPHAYNRFIYGLKDGEGLKYQEPDVQCLPEFLINSGELAPGERIRGTLRYEVKESARGLVLEYSLFGREGTRIRISLD